MREPRIRRAHRGDQRIDDLALDPVRKMARIRDVLKAAPAVGDFLVLGERVGDQREGALIGLEGFRQRLRRGLALFRGALLQQRQRRLDREFLAPDLEAKRRNGLIELPVPGAVSRLRLLMEQLLDAVLKLIRLVLAQILDPGPVVIERRHRHRALDHLVIDTVEFKREKQKMGRGRGDALGHVAVELRDRRIDRIARVREPRIGRQPSGKIINRLIAPDRLGQPLTAVRRRDLLRDLALIGALERHTVGIELIEIACHLRRIDRRIEVGQIPLRQLGCLA